MKTLAFFLFLMVTATAPTHDAKAQDVLGGALLGGVAGGVLGGVITGGRGPGIAIGAVLGMGAGAAIAAEGQRNRRGYYAYHRGCWIQRRDGAWLRVADRNCY